MREAERVADLMDCNILAAPILRQIPAKVHRSLLLTRKGDDVASHVGPCPIALQEADANFGGGDVVDLFELEADLQVGPDFESGGDQVDLRRRSCPWPVPEEVVVELGSIDPFLLDDAYELCASERYA